MGMILQIVRLCFSSSSPKGDSTADGQCREKFKKIYFPFYSRMCAYTPSPWLMWWTKLLTSVTLVVSHPHFTHFGQKAASQSATIFCQSRIAVMWLHAVFQTCRSVSVETQAQATLSTWRLERLTHLTFFILCHLLHVHQPKTGLIRWR